MKKFQVLARMSVDSFDKEGPVSRIHEMLPGLLDPRRTVRDQAVCDLIAAIAAMESSQLVLLERTLRDLLCKDSWEAQEAVLKVLVAITSKSSIAPSDYVEHVKTLFRHSESRVRVATADLAEAIAAHDKSLALYNPLKEPIFSDISAYLVLTENEPDSGAALPTTGEASFGSGASSLESAMMLLQRLIKGYGSAFPVDENLIRCIDACVQHKNRFVREQAQLTGAAVFSASPSLGHISWLSAGLSDTWEQVRFAAAAACRAAVLGGAEDVEGFMAAVVPTLVVNRHYSAEGLRGHIQETWKYLVGSRGGIEVVVKYLPEIFREISESVTSRNQGAREAAIFALAEMCQKIPGPFSENLARVSLEVLTEGLTDHSWPVRSVACQAGPIIFHFFRSSHSQVVSEFSPKLRSALRETLTDAVPGLRKDAAVAFSQIFGADETRALALKLLPSVLSQKISARNEPENQVMFSCCSFSATCQAGHSVEPWVKTEAGIFLLMEIGSASAEEEWVLRKILGMDASGSKVILGLQGKIRENFEL